MQLVDASEMQNTPIVNEWLPWLGRVRFLVITFLLTIVVSLHQLTRIPFPIQSVLALLAVWYALATTYVISQRCFWNMRWQAPAQIIGDLVVITAVVYETGAQDSYFISLYLLAILMGSIVFSRRGAFLLAGASFIMLGCVIELVVYGVIPRTATSVSGCANLNPGWEATCLHSLRWLTSEAFWRKRRAPRMPNSTKSARN